MDAESILKWLRDTVAVWSHWLSCASSRSVGSAARICNGFPEDTHHVPMIAHLKESYDPRFRCLRNPWPAGHPHTCEKEVRSTSLATRLNGRFRAPRFPTRL